MTTGASILALALTLAAAPAAVAAPPSLDGFAKLPFPKDRQAQARDIQRIVGAVAAGDPKALQAALAPSAALKVDSGTDMPLTLEGLARALDGCSQVVDFAIPAAENLLGIVWACEGSERAAYFRFNGDRLSSVHVATNYVAYAPPPIPPRAPLIQAEMRSRAALSTVRSHFGVIANRDPAELEALYLEASAIPVSWAGRPGVLRDLYREQVAPEDGRQVRLTGCRTAPGFPTTERVDCTLIVDLPGTDGVAARSTYQLGYMLRGRKVERVIVTPVQPGQASD